MAGVRVLVSGMGGELGSRIASLLENQPWVGALEGIDVDPPRRQLRRTRFHRIVPGQHDRTVETVTRFDPHVLVHAAVWEPDARAGTRSARTLTDDAAISILGAAAECRSLESIVVRSGVEVYGRARGTVTRPTEAAPCAPTSDYGRMLAEIERTASTIGDRVGVSVGTLRLATVLGPHVPSALGRILRLPVVPCSALADPPFAVIHQHDAAEAFVRAAELRIDEPLNIVAPGAITVRQAIRRGHRIPFPLVGPQWTIARQVAHMAGSPVPSHVLEMFHRGRLADNRRAREVFGGSPGNSTTDVIDQLYGWPSVIHRPAAVDWAAQPRSVAS
ncbi:MAG: NAD-dependent epimerase/dehydratase family protein [Ilumatobacteraceae bacterium]